MLRAFLFVLSLVVTRETGGNKFLKWDNDRFVYLLGQGEDRWRIVGLFLLEATNPEWKSY